MGFKYETAISSQPGFELLSFIDPIDGRRLVLWFRSGRITQQTVKHLLQLLKLRTDILMICFEKDISITEDAEQLLREKFPQVLIRRSASTSRARSREENIVSLYDDSVRILGSGKILIIDSEKAYRILQSASKDELWLLVITITPEGKVVIFDTPKDTFNMLIEKELQANRKVVVFGIHQSKMGTNAILLYPKVQR